MITRGLGNGRLLTRGLGKSYEAIVKVCRAAAVAFKNIFYHSSNVNAVISLVATRHGIINITIGGCV